MVSTRAVPSGVTGSFSRSSATVVFLSCAASLMNRAFSSASGLVLSSLVGLSAIGSERHVSRIHAASGWTSSPAADLMTPSSGVHAARSSLTAPVGDELHQLADAMLGGCHERHD